MHIIHKPSFPAPLNICNTLAGYFCPQSTAITSIYKAICHNNDLDDSRIQQSPQYFVYPTPFSEVLIHTYASTCAHIYPTCGPIVYPLCTGLCVIVYCILLLYYMYTDVPDHGLKRSIK